MRVSWQSLYDEIYACEKCELCRQIHNKVPGQGDIHAKLMFIGEGPGADEDMQGFYRAKLSQTRRRGRSHSPRKNRPA